MNNGAVTPTQKTVIPPHCNLRWCGYENACGVAVMEHCPTRDSKSENYLWRLICVLSISIYSDTDYTVI